MRPPKSKSTSALASIGPLRYNERSKGAFVKEHRPLSWPRRFAIAAVVLCVIVLALLAAVVMLAPKAINSGEVRSRIEAVVAKELNGTFTYDRVELSLLPRPDVVLHKVQVELPGALSATIAAVRVRARLLPLFQGRFVISSIALEQPDLSLTLADGTAGRKPRRQPVPQRSGGSFDKALAVASRELPDLSIKIKQGKIALLREGRSIVSLGDLDASLAFVSDGQEGPQDGTGGAEYHVTGTAQATVRGTAALPAPLKVSVTRFDAVPGRLTITNARARLQDLDASLSGDLKGYLTGSPRSDYQARGTIGPEALAWLRSLASLPDTITFRAPLTVASARLRSTGTGSTAARTFTVSARNEGGSAVSLELRQGPGLFSIDNLHVKDSDSDAVVKFSSGPEEEVASFTGSLSGATIDRLLVRGRPTPGWLKGDLLVRLPHGQWEGATVHGSLEGGQLGLPARHELPITIDRFTVHADDATVDLEQAALSLGQEVLQVSGTASLEDGGLGLDLDIATEKLSLSTVRALVERKPKERPAVPGTDAGRTPNVRGSARLHAAAFVMDQYRADAVDMLLNIGNTRTTATLGHASICGITFTGSMQAVGSEVEISFKPQARGGKLEESLPCIFHKELAMSGTYNLSGQIGGHGTWDTLLGSLEGSIALSASQGRIQSDHVVKGVIAYLNSTSLLKGAHDKLMKEGVPFETISIRSTLHDGTLSLSEAVIRSRDLNIAAEGNIDLREGTLALNVLAAPFTKLDRFLGNVPLVKSLVGNALIAVPARVEGTFQHPSVKPMPVSGVGKNVTNLLKNTLQAPMKIVDPALPKELEGKNARTQE